MRIRPAGARSTRYVRGLLVLTLCTGAAGCSFTSSDAATGAQYVGIDGVSAPEARRIAKEAYVYGYPMVASYQAMYAASIDPGNPHYRGPFNTLGRAEPAPDDAPQFSAVLDLRAEPVVISAPPMEARRYHALRLTDLYGYNFAYIGSRATGNGGGKYLVAGPRWNGVAPKGMATVIRAETELVSLAGRIQRFSASDQANVKRIEAGYRIQTLSAYLKKAPPKPATVEWLTPEPPAQMRTSLEYYNQLGFLLQFAPVAHSEKTLRKRLDSMRIRPDAPAVTDRSNPRLRQVMQEGMHDGQNEIDKRRLALDGKADTLFGDRRTLGNDYLARATGAQVGLGTDSREESITAVLATDAAGQPLDGAQPYTLRFAPRALPPVNAFWSVTLQRPAGATQAPHAARRTLVDSSMLPALKRDRDGGLTLHIQPQTPGKGGEANWLPAPAGPFTITLRYYWPKPALLDGSWQSPQPQRVGL